MTGPASTSGTGFGCACASHDARECAWRRYGLYYREEDCSAEVDDRCECLCHGWDDEEQL